MEKTKIANRLKKKYKIIIIACEPSGDSIGSELIEALKRTGFNFEFSGIGGEQMINQGFRSILPIENLSIMGFIEVIIRLPLLLFRLYQTVIKILKFKPDIMITVDSPGFNFLLVSKLRKYKVSFPIIHYVAPTVWAYSPQRVFKVKALYDHLLTILPFENKYFEKAGVACTYIGYPAAESKKITINKDDIKKKYNLKPNALIVAMIPGSRKQELKYHLPILLDTAKILLKKYPNIIFFIPTFQHLKKYCDKMIFEYNLKDNILIIDQKEKKELIYISNAALVKSGTVTVEFALSKIPMVIFYKTSWLNAFLIKRKIQLKYISLLNIMLKKMVIPELLQENCTSKKLSIEIDRILSKSKATIQIKAMEKFIALLQSPQYPKYTSAELATIKIMNILNNRIQT